MIFHASHFEVQEYAYVMDGGVLASNGLERTWTEEVVPHFYAPFTRQPVPCPPALNVTPESTLEAELESPNFVPDALSALAARGFQRKNSWRR